ncbi:hypothetical protein [Alloscardovia omnicolens]|uniref:hypothetical protein n=1 Tax=Alloscardovia omnicolens TaxID=419015 RepID=UPI003A5F6B5B
MKKISWRIATLAAILISVAALICTLFFYENQPKQVVLEIFGVEIPSSIKIESFHTESAWDGRLYYGSLTVSKDRPTGLVDTKNFVPLAKTEDSRVSSLVKDVNNSFSISTAKLSNPSLLYHKITVKDDSLLVIFYDSDSSEYFFYGTRY